jgi:hypothetical protein
MWKAYGVLVAVERRKIPGWKGFLTGGSQGVPPAHTCKALSEHRRGYSISGGHEVKGSNQ